MEQFTIPENETAKIRLGRLLLYVKKESDEIHYAHDYVEDEQEKVTYSFVKKLRNHDEFDWTRCILGSEYETFELVPKMPDKPVVVRPELAVQVPQRKSTSFYVGIFVWLQLYGVHKRSRIKICDFPTIRLSKTWFGANETGELCYSMKTKAIREKEKTTSTYFHATCPVHVVNNSDDMLDFARICLHVEYLSLYSDGSRLWGNEARVIYKGPEQISQINLSNTAPKEAPKCVKIADPRMTGTPNLVKRSFYFLKYLTGLLYA